MDTTEQTRHSVLREAHLRDYWKIVWQGRWTVLAVFIVVVGATGLWTFLQTPIYSATATVEVQPQARRLLSNQDVSGLGAAGYGWLAEEKYHNTQIEIIRSRDVSQRVVQTLDLASHPMFEGHPDPVELFRYFITVVPRRDTGLLEISILGTDPYEITQWVNAVAQSYVARNFDRAQENVQRSVELIRQQLNDLNQDLAAVEERRIKSLQNTEIYDAENQEAILSEKLKAFATELTEVSIEAQQIEAVLNQIDGMATDGGDLMSLSEFAGDERLQLLNRDRLELEREIERAKVDLRPDHPEFEKLRSSMRAVERRIREHVDLIVAGLESRFRQASTKRDMLEAEIRSTELESLRIARATSEYDTIKTEAETTRQIFDLITKTMREVQLSAQLMNNNVGVLDKATPPLFPIKPRKKLNVAIGAMMGLFLGLGLVFFLDYLDNTIRNPEDIEKFLGVSVLGVVPKMQEGKGLAERPIREAFQSLRTSVIFSSKNRERRVIMITSTSPQEGKSSTIANLARTLAAAGDRVVVIDGDLRKPKQHVHHELDREPGLTNFLAAPRDQTDWRPFVQTAQPNLDMITCGPIPPSPPELLGSERFKALVGELRASYDWVLLDSPPAATLADASLLASFAEMAIMVVRHNSTDRDHVVKTFHQLRAVSANVVGVVLNNVDMDRAYNKDYYYAGYYYEDEAGTSKRSRRRGGVEPKAQVG